jgi:hypothetical protein
MSRCKVISDANAVELETCRDSHGKWTVTANTILVFQNTDIMRLLEKHLKNNMAKQGLGDLPADVVFDPYARIVKFKNISNIEFKNNFMLDFSIEFNSIKECLEEKYMAYLDIDMLNNDLSERKTPHDTICLINNNLHLHTPFYSVKRIAYIRPFRGYPQRIYTSGSEPSPLATYFNNRNKIIPYKYDHESKSIKSGTVNEALHYWIVDYFKLVDRIEVEEVIAGLVSVIYLVIGGKKIPINNVGFGTSQIIPVIYKTLVSRSDLIIVDEPEIHLHASIQSKLATFFFIMMLIGKRLLLETHSEYLIDKLIYHNIMQPEGTSMAKLCWVIKTDDGSIIENILHDELGYIMNTPDGFLSEKKALVKEINALRMDKL